MHSGLSGREIDRYVIQQEAKEGWQWYSDVDLRPWHCLIPLWRANSHYRPTPPGLNLFSRIIKGALYVAMLVLVGPFVLVLSTRSASWTTPKGSQKQAACPAGISERRSR
jgi:hypothetical protein